MNYKTILACAAFLTGMVFFNGRLNAAVESDIVGYSTIDAKAGFNLLGISFATLNTTNDGINVQSIQGTFQEQDSIQYWDGTQLKTLVYYNASSYGPAGWYDLNDNVSSEVLAPGEGFWLKVAQETKITIAGKVVEGESGNVEAPAGTFTLVASSYPKEIAFNDVTFTGISENDQVQYWDGTQLKTLVYYNASSYGPAGWYDLNDNVSDRDIKIGEGFWILPKNKVTIQF